MKCWTHYLEAAKEDAEFWVSAHNNMALLFKRRTKGCRADNINKSLEHYVASKVGMSLEEITPGLVAFGTGSWGLRYYTDWKPDIGEAAVTAMIKKLHVSTKEEDPTTWARNQLQLADKCLKQSNDKVRRENIEKAIGYCESATEVFTKESFPDKWADVQMQLFAAYMQRAEGVRRDNMEKAIRCFEACKEVRPGETLPDEFLKQQWAKGAGGRIVGPRDAGVATESRLWL
jgi:hypothetical protein